MAKRQAEPLFGTVNFERRKHPRFSINLPVEYWLDSAPKSRPARTGDVSEGGLLLYLPGEIAAGQDLRLRLFIDSGLDFMSIEALVQVVWKDLNLGDKENYRTGVRFVEISAQDDKNLRNFLTSLVEMKSHPRIHILPGLLSSSPISSPDGPASPPPKNRGRG